MAFVTKRLPFIHLPGTTSGKIICTSSNTAPAPALLGLIVDEKWIDAQNVLSKENERHACCDSLVTSGLGRADLKRALLEACRHCPPTEFVRSLLDICPDAASATDVLTDRYPLHIALEFAASSQVIKILTERHPAAVCTKDGSGKTPLHILCDSYVQSFRERGRCPEKLFKKKRLLQCDDRPVDECMLSIVKYLRQAAPTCINLEDKAGMTALELAVINYVDKETISVMHSWSQRDWKNMKKPGYGQPGAQDKLWIFKETAEDTLWSASPRFAIE